MQPISHMSWILSWKYHYQNSPQRWNHSRSTISNIFNQHFSFVGNSLVFDQSKAPIFSPSSRCRNSCFSFHKIYLVEVQHAINELKDDCGPPSSGGFGPDGIETKFIKLAARILMSPLCDLYNLPLLTCSLPSAWKSVIVTPLRKGCDPNYMNKYRPISIINPIQISFEKLIFKQLSHYVTKCNILSSCQPGFRPNFSTTTALLKFTNDIFTASENGQLTGAIFLDVTKAFDIVDHYLLLDKLYSIGISWNSLLWLNSYLHNRRQCVNFTGNQSDYIIV